MVVCHCGCCDGLQITATGITSAADMHVAVLLLSQTLDVGNVIIAGVAQPV
jgi:hypothetical protein